MLLKAIFALSARHLSKITKSDGYDADKYYRECLAELIPLLDEESAVMDETVLVATIILRLMEELDSENAFKLIKPAYPGSLATPPDDHLQGHLVGIQKLISAQERAAAHGGLRQAAFLVGLRREIFMAFVTQRPVRVSLEYCNIDCTLSATDDTTGRSESLSTVSMYWRSASRMRRM
jgi:hypothetical protein